MSQTVTYAGFWMRVLAHLIDSLLIGSVQLVFILPFIGLVSLGFLETHAEFHPTFLFIAIAGVVMGMVFAFLTGWLYYALMECSSHQATLGKLVARLRVTDMNGQRVSFARATARYFSRILSGLFFGVGFLMAAFTQQKQTLHDIIAGTLVVER